MKNCIEKETEVNHVQTQQTPSACNALSLETKSQKLEDPKKADRTDLLTIALRNASRVKQETPVKHQSKGLVDVGRSAQMSLKKSLSFGSLDSVLSDLSRYLSTNKTPKERWQSAFRKIKRIRALGGSRWKTGSASDAIWKDCNTKATVKSNLEIFLYGIQGNPRSTTSHSSGHSS